MEIAFEKMTEEDLKFYLEKAIPNYANEKMKGEGLDGEEAMRLSKKSFESLLPNGIHSENQFLFKIVEAGSGERLGILWFAKRGSQDRQYAYIYDIELSSDCRGQGIGKMAMNQLEAEVKKMGLSSIGLHVFGHNKVAIGLYEKMGFRTTNRIMVKNLEE